MLHKTTPSVHVTFAKLLFSASFHLLPFSWRNLADLMVLHSVQRLISDVFSSSKSYYESCGIQRDSKDMLTTKCKASNLCNYLHMIYCKNGLRNTLVKVF